MLMIIYRRLWLFTDSCPISQPRVTFLLAYSAKPVAWVSLLLFCPTCYSGNAFSTRRQEFTLLCQDD